MTRIRRSGLFSTNSFVFIDKGEILARITLVRAAGNRINITSLALRQSCDEAGKQLVEYIVAKYGAKGASTFLAAVDISHNELAELFMSCGFRQCSTESLLKIDTPACFEEDPLPYRPCRNSDADEIAMLYNSELITHFKPSLERTKQEYSEPFFAGLAAARKIRYVLESGGQIVSCLSISTNDNRNFVIDVCTSSGYEISYKRIINFALSEISKQRSEFQAFVKLRNYTKTASALEKYLTKNNFECVQTQMILVKDFYKPLKQQENVLKVFLLGENGAFSN